MGFSLFARKRVLAAAVSGFGLLAPFAHADNLQWDPGNVGPPGSGGNGTWDTSTVEWFDQNNNSEVAWNNAGQSTGADAAFFNATPGVVTLGAPIVANGLTFNVGGYTLGNGGVAANNLTLVSGSSLNQAAGAMGTNTISAQLVLSGETVNIDGGTMLLTNTTAGSANVIDSGTNFNVNPGATLGFNAVSGANPLGQGNVTLSGGTLQLTPMANGTPGMYGTKFSTAGYKNNNLWSNDFKNAAPLAGSPTMMSGQNNTSTTPATTTTGLTFNSTGSGPAVYTGGPTTNFLDEMTGALQIATGGAYTFQTSSDDASRLYIDNKLVVNNDGGHGMQNFTSQPVNLTPGLHEFRLDYIQGGGGFGLIANYNGPDTGNANKVIGSVTPTGGITNGIETLDPISMGNNVTLTQDSTINLNGNNFTQVGLGNLTFAQPAGTAATLNVTGNAGTSLHLTGTSVLGGANNTFANVPDVFAGPLSFSGTEAGTTLTAAGPGQLFFDNNTTANPMTSASTIAIPTGGRVVAVGSSATGAVNPLGGATIALNGGTLSLDTQIGNVTYANNVNVTGTSTIEVQPSGITMDLGSATGSMTVPTGANLNVNIYTSDGNEGAGALRLDSPITGAGNISTVAGFNTGATNTHGTLIFNVSSPAYSGVVTLNANSANIQGNVNAATDQPFGTNPNGLVIHGGTLYMRGGGANTTTYTLPQNVNADASFTLDGNQNGTFTNGTFVFQSLNDTATAATTITQNAGNGFNFQFNAPSTFAGPVTINPNSDTLTFNNTVNGAGNLTVGGNGGTVTFAQPITLAGTSNLTLAGASTANINAPAVYTGATILTGTTKGGPNGGTLKIGVDNALPVALPATIDVQSLDLNGHNQTFNNLGASAIGTAGTIINNGSAVSTLTIGNPSLTFNGQLADGGKPLAVALAGTGQTLTLAGQNTFSGGINIPAGDTLVAANGTAVGTLGNGTITLSGGSLLLQGQQQPSSAGLSAGLAAKFYTNSPLNSGNHNPNFNTLPALNSHLSGQTPAKSVNTTLNGKSNFDFSNANYGSAAPFGQTSPAATQANYGFTNTTNYEATFTGYINVPAAGWGQFSTNSDDGSAIYIDNQNVPVVNNNAFQGNTNRVGSFYFPQAGLYPITIGYYQGGGGQGLLVQWAPPGNNGGFHTLLDTEVMSGTPASLQQLSNQGYVAALNVTGDSNIDVSGSLNASVGPLTIGSNKLSLTSADTTANPYSLTTGIANVTGAATFDVAPSAGGGPGTLNIPAVNGGASSSITKSNAGTVVLSASGTYGGGTTINAGVLRANGLGSLGTGPVTLNGGTLRLGSQTEAPLANFGGFQLNDGATLANNVLTLTTTAASQARSAFYTTPQDVSKGFTTSFVYTDKPNSSTNNADGITFTVQNAQLGAGSLGGGGGSLGYGGIGNSGAVELNIYTGATGGVGTSFGTNGAIVANQTTAPVNLASGDPIQIQLTYDPNAQTLTETLTDQTTAATDTITYNGVNFSSLLGGNVGYVGFTGGTGGQNSNQTVGNFTFNGVSANPNLASWNNAVTVTPGKTATIDVASSSNGNNAQLGTLAMGDGSVLQVTGTTLASNAPYSLILGATTLSGNSTFDVANNGTGDGTVALGDVNGPAATLGKSNNGILVLNGTGTSVIGTGIVAPGGLLRVNTHLTVGMQLLVNGGTLGGKGTIDGEVNIAGGGTLAPSNRAGGLIGGPLTLTGPLTLANDTSTLAIVLASPSAPGTGYDQIAFGNTASLGGATLLLDDSTYPATAAKGDKFWILDGTSGSSPVTGELSYAGSMLADSSMFTDPNGVTYEINYNAAGDPSGTGHDVLLTETNAVPEPASLSMLALGAVGLLARRRRRV